MTGKTTLLRKEKEAFPANIPSETVTVAKRYVHTGGF